MFCVRESCEFHLFRDTNKVCRDCTMDSNYKEKLRELKKHILKMICEKLIHSIHIHLMN